MGSLIWLASYPKSGNTWMRSFLHNLFRNSSKPVNINEIDDFCLGASAAAWYKRYTSTPLDQLTERKSRSTGRRCSGTSPWSFPIPFS